MACNPFYRMLYMFRKENTIEKLKKQLIGIT